MWVLDYCDGALRGVVPIISILRNLMCKKCSEKKMRIEGWQGGGLWNKSDRIQLRLALSSSCFPNEMTDFDPLLLKNVVEKGNIRNHCRYLLRVIFRITREYKRACEKLYE
jgi:hypothetical protein